MSAYLGAPEIGAGTYVPRNVARAHAHDGGAHLHDGRMPGSVAHTHAHNGVSRVVGTCAHVMAACLIHDHFA